MDFYDEDFVRGSLAKKSNESFFQYNYHGFLNCSDVLLCTSYYSDFLNQECCDTSSCTEKLAA